MNTNELCQRTNIPEPHQQTSRPSVPQSQVKVSGFWVGYCLQAYSVKCMFKPSRTSFKLLLISEKVKSSGLLYPYPFLQPLKNLSLQHYPSKEQEGTRGRLCLLFSSHSLASQNSRDRSKAQNAAAGTWIIRQMAKPKILRLQKQDPYTFQQCPTLKITSILLTFLVKHL